MGTVAGLAAATYPLSVLMVWLLSRAGVPAQTGWRILMILIVVFWVPVCAWAIWHPMRIAGRALAEQDRRWAAEAAAISGELPDPRERLSGLRALDRVAHADNALEDAALEVLRDQAEEVVAEAARWDATVAEARRRGLLDAELIGRALAAHAAADAACTDLEFACILAGERMRARYESLHSRRAVVDEILETGVIPAQPTEPVAETRPVRPPIIF
jgi:hypothetical protein